MEAAQELKDFLDEEFTYNVELVSGPDTNQIDLYISNDEVNMKSIYTASVPLSPSDKPTIEYILTVFYGEK